MQPKYQIKYHHPGIDIKGLGEEFETKESMIKAIKRLEDAGYVIDYQGEVK